jgi:hypothetical protein
MSKEDFVANHLPIDDTKYNSLMSESGLNGYKLMNGMSGNVYLAHGDKNICPLKGDTKIEIIPELNRLKVGGKNKSRRNKKNKKSRKNRKTSRR